MKRPAAGRPKRVAARREPRRIIRVLTEGSVTEPAYLTQWARHSTTVHVDLAESGMAPLSLVQHARDHQRANARRPRKQGPDFDEIWCVFDVDQHPNLPQALHEARQSNIHVALSNPCFELWLLLHYEDHTAHIERHDAQRRTATLGVTDGKRLLASATEELLSRHDDATQRAQALAARHLGNGDDPASNPSSNVWELIDELRHPDQN